MGECEGRDGVHADKGEGFKREKKCENGAQNSTKLREVDLKGEELESEGERW